VGIVDFANKNYVDASLSGYTTANNSYRYVIGTTQHCYSYDCMSTIKKIFMINTVDDVIITLLSPPTYQKYGFEVAELFLLPFFVLYNLFIIASVVMELLHHFRNYFNIRSQRLLSFLLGSNMVCVTIMILLTIVYIINMAVHLASFQYVDVMNIHFNNGINSIVIHILIAVQYVFYIVRLRKLCMYDDIIKEVRTAGVEWKKNMQKYDEADNVNDTTDANDTTDPNVELNV